MPELREALVESAARKAVVLNLAPQAGETDGFSPEQHLEVLAEHAPDLRLDVVLADRGRGRRPRAGSSASPTALGAELVVADLAVGDGTPRHDPVKLADAYAGFSRRHKVARPRPPAARTRSLTDRDLGEGGRRGRIGRMAMTAQVKAELASTQVTKTCCRKAEVSSMLRFAGGLHIVSGRIVVEAELDTGAAARRLRRDIAEVYGHHSDVVMVSGNGIRKGSRYVVRVVRDGEALARQTGLLDQRGRPVRGLPPAGRLRRRLRRRRRLARRVPGPRLAHRARPLLGARGHLPRPRGRPGPGRRRPPARHPGQGPRGPRRRPRGDPRRRRDRRSCSPGSAPTSR